MNVYSYIQTEIDLDDLTREYQAFVKQMMAEQ